MSLLWARLRVSADDGRRYGEEIDIGTNRETAIIVRVQCLIQ